MSATATSGNSGSLSTVKRSLLRGFIALRRRPWFAAYLIGAAFIGIGYLLDPSRPPIDHGIFAGMFLIWGVLSFIIGVSVYAGYKAIVLWSAYVEGY